MNVLASGGRDERGAGRPGEACGLRRGGRAKTAPIAEASATPAATRMPIATALTKALCAAPTSSLPCSPPTCLPMLSAAATELVARWATRLGACAVASTLASRDGQVSTPIPG